MNISAERITQIVSPTPVTLELLVLGCSKSDANAYAQVLRNSGMVVHLSTAINPDELEDLLQDLRSDMVLVDCDAEELDFTTAITQIREICPLASFILLSDNPVEQLFFAAETRAQDIIVNNDHAHLITSSAASSRICRLGKSWRPYPGRCGKPRNAAIH